MAMIQMPENFNPEFSKDYIFYGREFKIELQYRGIDLDDSNQRTYHCWAFMLKVADELIVAGPFRQETEDGRIELEELADKLSEFYGSNIEGIIERSREERAIKEALSPSLEELVLLCRDYMFREFFQGMDTDPQDYDILQSITFEGGWTIILSPAVEPAKLFMFEQRRPGDRVHISTYIKALKYSVDRL